jgi:DNA-directed RNA polymerase specialized sigma24 family protein
VEATPSGAMDDAREQATEDECSHELWGKVLMQARRFLRRWNDRFTRTRRDDLAQDAAVALWCFLQDHRDAVNGPAIVHTISRQARCRALKVAFRAGVAVAEGDLAADLAAQAMPQGTEQPCLRVDGMLVPREWLLVRLLPLLHSISDTNRRLVLAYYEGFSCSELGERFGLSEQAVKVRLHRSRAVLRRKLEGMTRAAGHFEA